MGLAQQQLIQEWQLSCLDQNIVSVVVTCFSEVQSGYVFVQASTRKAVETQWNWGNTLLLPTQAHPVDSALSITATSASSEAFIKNSGSLLNFFRLDTDYSNTVSLWQQSGQQNEVGLTYLLIMSQREGLGYTCAILPHVCSLLSWAEVVYSCFCLSDCTSAEMATSLLSYFLAISAAIAVK